MVVIDERSNEPGVATPAGGKLGTANCYVLLRGVLGGILGGVTGFVLFQLLAHQGLYGMMIPGACIGLCAGLLARGRSLTLGVACALTAIGLSLFSEWYLFPFVKDKSFTFFLTHVHFLPPMKLLMMGLGVAFAFWLGQGR